MAEGAGKLARRHGVLFLLAPKSDIPGGWRFQPGPSNPRRVCSTLRGLWGKELRRARKRALTWPALIFTRRSRYGPSPDFIPVRGLRPHFQLCPDSFDVWLGLS
jgi:hypothetical protein